MKRPNTSVSVLLTAWLIMPLNTLGDSPQDLPQVSNINPATLAAVRQRVLAGDASLQPAVDALMKSAASAMKTSAVSVMDKPEAFPGGDKHDYVSYAPYFWPNPDTKDGLPYVRHDGKRNREQMAKGDAPRFEKMIGAVTTLALAYELSDKESDLTSPVRSSPRRLYLLAMPGGSDTRPLCVRATVSLVPSTIAGTITPCNQSTSLRSRCCSAPSLQPSSRAVPNPSPSTSPVNLPTPNSFETANPT